MTSPEPGKLLQAIYDELRRIQATTTMPRIDWWRPPGTCPECQHHWPDPGWGEE